ncbi:chorismate-binding protein [Shigella flexneri]
MPFSARRLRRAEKEQSKPVYVHPQDNDFTLFGASPESSLKYDATNRQIEMHPIAGTRHASRRADGSLDRTSTAASAGNAYRP